jgi:hypothetical protein
MPDRPALLVDYRQDKKFTEALRMHFAIVEKQLAVGDLVWTCPMGTVGLEDKCIPDLIHSQSNKRLDDELRRLVDSFAVPILFVRGFFDSGSRYRPPRDEASIANTLLGRQLHGVYTYQVPAAPRLAAEAVRRLYEYLQRSQANGIDGVRRARLLTFAGPLSPRAEIVYQILGMAGGVRNRRALAARIAQDTPLSKFLRWGPFDFEACGFSRRMATKLAATMRTLEEEAHG